MDRLVGFIDVGFLKAGSAGLLSKSVRDLNPRADEIVAWMKKCASNLPGSPEFLRAYWYDGAFDPRDSRHSGQRKYFNAIADVPGIQMRLGHLKVKKPSWQHPVKAALKNMGVDLADFEKHYQFRDELEQKGVDTRITLDLAHMAQRRVYDAAILISGDRDLAEPVEVAQDEGARIIVAGPEGAGVAPQLRRLADEFWQLDRQQIEGLFDIKS